MSAEDLERFETEVELALYQEYKAVLSLFKYVVETERRFYLANHVEVEPRGPQGGVDYMVIKLRDAWVWDMYRPVRFISEAQVITHRDVNIEVLPEAEV
ncbi:MAG: DUF2469 family protein [Acidimicrobiaceae bacterium]|nr:DUF2469 family protein [Acidimicrobiaceae bacterium]